MCNPCYEGDDLDQYDPGSWVNSDPCNTVTCPYCGSGGVLAYDDGTYSCPVCHNRWHYV